MKALPPADCPVTDTCQCEIDYIKAARTSDGDKCTALKMLISCLLGKTESSCDGTKASVLAAAASNSMPAPCTSGLTETCLCDKTYAQVDLTDGDGCIGKLAYMDCLSKTYDVGCDGSTQRNARASALDISACSPTDVCTCQSNYAKIDYTDASAECPAIKTALGCLVDKTAAGCSGSTIIDIATELDTRATATSCTLSSTCQCQVSDLKASKTDDTEKCTAHKTHLSCLMVTMDLACDGTRREARVTAIKDLTITACTLSTVCTTCMIAYGEAATSDLTAHCGSVKTLMTCLAGQDVIAGRGCNDIKTIATIVGDIESATSCTYTSTCDCERTYMKSPGTDAATKCTALTTLMHCLDGSVDANCDDSKRRDEAATFWDAKIVDDLNIGNCETGLTTTCSSCQIVYAKTDPTTPATHCTNLYKKFGCLAGELSTACLTSVAAHGVAAYTNPILGAVNPACSTTDTCLCQKTLAETDITVATNHCAARKAELACLKGKTDAGCDTTSTPEALDIAAKKVIDTIGTTDCPVTPTCACELVYAKADLGDDSKKCTAWLNELACLRGKTDIGCDGSTTRDEVDRGIKQKMDVITTPTAKCTTNEICLCEIAYAVAAQGTDAEKCTALKNYISCLAGKTGTGCDGVATARELATAANALLTAEPLKTACPLTDACQCDVAYAMADIASDHCTHLNTLFKCLDDLNDPGQTETSCDDTKNVATLASNADSDYTGASCPPKTDTCSCIVDFLKAGTTDLCSSYKAKIDCLTSAEGTICGAATLRNAYAPTEYTSMEAAPGCSAFSAGTVCNDCQKVYLSAAPGCGTLETYFNCLYGLATDTSCNGATTKTLIDAQETSYSTTHACTASTACACQRTFLTTAISCDSVKLLIDCLWEATDAPCAGTLHAAGTTADGYVTSNSCSLTDVCTCQKDFAMVDQTTGLCAGLKTQFQCLETATGAGCKADRTLRQVAENGHTLLPGDCTKTAACDCQIAYLRADVSGANACPEAEKKVACLYATTTAGCDDSTPRTTLVENTDTVINTCTLTGSCSCQRTYGKATGFSECIYQLGVITCLQDTTDTGCTGTAPFTKTRSELGTAIETYVNAGANSCTVTDTCQCEINYAKATVSPTNPNKCDAQAERMECLVAATGVACDGSTTRSTYATTAHTALQAVTGCEASLSDTCTACEITYAKAASDTQANRCTALKDYFHCLDSKTATSCHGSKSVTTLATEADSRATSDSCALGETCTCQANYLKADKSTATLDCTAKANKMSCLAVSFDTACDGSTTRDAVATTTDTALAGCTGLTDVCGCEKTYAVEAFSVPATHCTNLKAAVNCLEGKTANGCGATATISTFSTKVLAKITEIGTGTCPISNTCQCQIGYLTDDISSSTLKCDALEKKQACLYEADSTACDGSTARKDVITSVDADITSGSCTVPSSCRCQIDYGKSTITPDTAKCTALKTMVNCLQSTADTGCVGTTTKTRTELATVLETFATSSGDCSHTGACTCQLEYAKADVTGANKCSSLKALVVCLGKVTDTGCTGISTHSLVTTAAGEIDAITGCPAASGTTCKCQLDHAKMDRSTSSLACSALKKELSCLFESTGSSCDGTETKRALATAVDTAASDPALSCTAASAECTCATTYAKADIVANEDKCTAAKALLSCISGKTGTGCDGVQTVTTMTTVAQAAIQAVVNAGVSCALTDSCQCEVTYSRADRSSSTSHCTAAVVYYACLVSASDVGCSGTSNADLRTAAQTEMASISGCSLPDTCSCEETYRKDFAAAGANQCKYVKNALNCLATASSNSCDDTKTNSEVTTQFETLQTSISSSTCFLTETCKCQVQYGKANTTSSSALKCSAANVYKNCVINVQNDQDVACDDITQNRHILSGHVNIVLQACRGCSLSNISLFASLILVFVALILKQ